MLRVKATRTSLLQEEEVFHQDLAPLIELLKLDRVEVVRSHGTPGEPLEWEDVEARVRSLSVGQLAEAYCTWFGERACSEEFLRSDPEDFERAVALVTAKECEAGLARWSRETEEARAEQDGDRILSDAATEGLQAATLAGVPLPRFSKGVTPVSNEFLSQRSGIFEPDSELNLASHVEGCEVFAGHVRRPARPMPEGLAPDVRMALQRLSGPVLWPTHPGSVIVRDYLELLSCTWLVVDYSLDGTSYRLFQSKARLFAPSGSPVDSEPDFLLGRCVMDAGQRHNRINTVACLRQALSELPVYRPTPERLASFVTRLPSLSITRAQKHELVDVIEAAVSREESVLDLLYSADCGRVTPALLTAVRKRIDRTRHVAVWVAAIAVVVGLGVAAAATYVWDVPWTSLTLANIRLALEPSRDDEETPAALEQHSDASPVLTDVISQLPSTATAQLSDLSDPEQQSGAGEAVLTEEDASSVLVRWLESQNSADFTAYARLYAPMFVGVKRSGSRSTTLPYKDWLEDRRRMFGAKFRVAAQNPRFIADRDSMTVFFTQDWESPRYRDRGTKRIVLRRIAGEVLIVEEVMEDATILRRRTE